MFQTRHRKTDIATLMTREVDFAHFSSSSFPRRAVICPKKKIEIVPSFRGIHPPSPSLSKFGPFPLKPFRNAILHPGKEKLLIPSASRDTIDQSLEGNSRIIKDIKSIHPTYYFHPSRKLSRRTLSTTR